MHCEELVVGLSLEKVSLRRQQLQPDQYGKEATHKKEKGDGGQIKQCDALVIGGEQPRFHAVVHIEIVLASLNGHDGCSTCTHFVGFCLSEAGGCFCSGRVLSAVA